MRMVSYLAISLFGPKGRLRCMHRMFTSLVCPILYLKMLLWCCKAPEGEGGSQGRTEERQEREKGEKEGQERQERKER